MASLAVRSLACSSCTLLQAAFPLKAKLQSARHIGKVVCAASNEQWQGPSSFVLPLIKIRRELENSSIPQIAPDYLDENHETAMVDLLKPFGGLITSTTLGICLLTVTPPAYALDFDFSPELIQTILTGAVFAVLYFFVFPLLIYYYLEKRWYKRKMAEAILQFGLVFLFFPGLLLLAPFINFRALPRDGAKEPWDEIRPTR